MRWTTMQHRSIIEHMPAELFDDNNIAILIPPHGPS